MESFLLLFDCIAIVLVVLWFVRNETRPPGEPVGGLLRYTEADPAGAPKRAPPLKPGAARLAGRR